MNEFFCIYSNFNFNHLGVNCLEVFTNKEKQPNRDFKGKKKEVGVATKKGHFRWNLYNSDLSYPVPSIKSSSRYQNIVVSEIMW